MGRPSLRASSSSSASLAFAMALFLIPAPSSADPHGDSRVDARSGGNRRSEARAIVSKLLLTRWSAQIVKVRVDGVGGHEVAGIILEGGNFHGTLSWRGFTQEVGAVATQALATGRVDEVDIWATVPLELPPNAVVSGDYALPTTKTVFSLTVQRGREATIARRLASRDGVFVEPEWRRGSLLP